MILFFFKNLISNRVIETAMAKTKKSKFEVTVYTTSTCPYCKMAKEYLTKKGVKFREIDVSSDQVAAEEMIKKSGQIGVPQIEVNGKMILGFDEAALEKELSKE